MCPTETDLQSPGANDAAQPSRIADKRIPHAESQAIAEARRAERILRLSEGGRPPSILKAVLQVPKFYQDRRAKAVLGIASPKVCIRAFCEQCMGYSSRLQEGIRDCTALACPLHFYRPYQQSDD